MICCVLENGKLLVALFHLTNGWFLSGPPSARFQTLCFYKSEAIGLLAGLNALGKNAFKLTILKKFWFFFIKADRASRRGGMFLPLRTSRLWPTCRQTNAPAGPSKEQKLAALLLRLPTADIERLEVHSSADDEGRQQRLKPPRVLPFAIAPTPLLVDTTSTHS